MFFDPEGARYEWALKRGFRHVFCVIDDGTYWILVDGRDAKPVVQVLQASTYDLKAFYEGQEGYSVIEVDAPTKPLRTPFVLVNCVGLVKIHLCIRAPWAMSPWQLYKHLERKRNEITWIRRFTFNTSTPSAASGAGRPGDSQGEERRSPSSIEAQG